MKKFFCFGLKDFCDCDILCTDCQSYDDSGGEYREAPISNADHIRSMTDEELAEFWVEPVCGIRTEEECKKNFRMECAACFLDWLKQPYKEVDS